MRTSITDSPQFAPLSSSSSSSSKPHRDQLQQQLQHQRNFDSDYTSPFLPPCSYEPTSVLDPHLTSSPTTTAAAVAGDDDPLLLLLDLPSLPPPTWDPIPTAALSSSSDDNDGCWLDPVSWFLGGDGSDDKDDNSLPPFPCSDLDAPFSGPPWAAAVLPDQIHLDHLILAAEAVDSGDLSLADAILARLNHSAAPTGRPIHRAACYFRDALRALLPTVRHHYRRPIEAPLLSPKEIVRKITADQALSSLSPIPQFAVFTANQTILESTAGSRSIHLIDLDIGLGGHWSSFLHEIAVRSPPPSVRITAVVSEESLETALAAANLRDFAGGLGLRLAIDFVPVGSSGALALAAVRLAGGDSVAVSLTPATFQFLGGASESVAGLLRFIRRISPRVTVFVDTEYSGSAAAIDRSSPPPCRRAVSSGLEYYSAVLESLDAVAAASACGEEVRMVEEWLIRPRVLASLEAAMWAPRPLPWREMFEAAGMRPIPFSEFTESQAEFLIKRARVGGFHVTRRDGAMVLSWHERELAATSAWKC